MIKKSLLCTALSVTAFSGWAQDTRPDTLVVTANRFQQPRSAVLAPITVVTRQDIDRWQSTSVNDVLRRLPGVDIAQYGGMGQNSSISIRGTNASHVLFKSISGDQQTGKLAIYDPAVDAAILIKAKKVLGIS